MSKDRFITFAYGSNMLTGRLRERCPSAKRLGVAELHGHELRWHKKSSDGSGKCDIVLSAHDARVFGVLYEIANTEKARLDRAEGLGSGYKEIEVHVRCGDKEMTAKAYQATDVDNALKPYSWYRALVLAGAREHRLPADYIGCLEAVAAQEDSERGRHDKNMRLAGKIEA